MNPKRAALWLVCSVLVGFGLFVAYVNITATPMKPKPCKGVWHIYLKGEVLIDSCKNPPEILSHRAFLEWEKQQRRDHEQGE